MALSASRQVPIPHEPGETLTLRALSWRQLDQAREVQAKRSLHDSLESTKVFRELDPDWVKSQMANAENREAAETRAAAPDTYSNYDMESVLRAGVIGWSYDTKFKPELLDDLDGATATWAFRELLRPIIEQSEKDRITSFFSPSTATSTVNSVSAVPTPG